MIKIIIYGVGNIELRSKVSSYIDDDVILLGVTDQYYNEDILQSENFIPLDALGSYEYDYIIMLIKDDKKRELAIDTLIRMSLKKETIITPYLLWQKDAEFIPNLKREIECLKDSVYDCLILGLSYAIRGIDYSLFKLKCYDFSWHGLDLYYNYLSLKLFIDTHFDSFERIRYVLMCFPCYYFNYDMSMSEYQFSTGQILACHGFGDWHNASESDNKLIHDYLICNEVFGRRFWDNKRWKKKGFISDGIMDPVKWEGLPAIWGNKYEKTFDNNIQIMKNLMEMIADKKVIVVIPPIYKKCFSADDFDKYNDNKRAFYEIVKNYSVEIRDFSELIDREDCFSDFDHLNKKGSNLFTNELNNVFFGY